MNLIAEINSIREWNGRKFNKELSYFEYENNELLLEAIRSGLPDHYDFEIIKTLKKIKELKLQVNNDEEFTVYLQMPEGLLLFSESISLILQHFGESRVIILGDITYGGCCIEDQLISIVEKVNSKSVNSSLLVHYAHSCLIPFDELLSNSDTETINVLYIFVEINLSAEHFINTVKNNFNKSDRVALLSTIQYHNTIVGSLETLNKYFTTPVEVPVCNPLAWGETLGCTSPVIQEETEICIFISDGRFHLESAMMQNPSKKFFLYDPFSKKITKEKYNYDLLHEMRKSAIINSYKKMFGNRKDDIIKNHIIVGIFFSTLGRQGSFKIVERLEKLVEIYNENNTGGPYIYISLIFASDLSSDYINKNIMDGIDYSIQLGCPRLSTDWGALYKKPLLNSYEGFILFVNLSKNNLSFFSNLEKRIEDTSEYSYRSVYPMNYWASNGDPWCNYYLNESRNGSFSACREHVNKIKLKIRQRKLKYIAGQRTELRYEN
ncbi:diphthamide synthesis protein [Cryptosporidium ryanae]|uniref:diphthamide synthesis protein n=1 Tax=Cryptosporidium ryanae TaxID=515981 RepID=UPI00351AACCC|nr:diphthamide synthesis protein [Cryptosporidium ryanae]